MSYVHEIIRKQHMNYPSKALKGYNDLESEHLWFRDIDIKYICVKKFQSIINGFFI